MVGGVHVRVGTRQFCFGGDEDATAAGVGTGEATASLVTAFQVGAPGGHGGAPFTRGEIRFSDELRPSALPLVQRLRCMGLRVVMLSGDQSAHLEATARMLGVKEYHSCLPHQKAERIAAMQRGGEVVLMVGDGGNDSAALKMADVGMCIGASNLAAESAGVVLLGTNLLAIADMVRVGRGSVGIARATVRYGMAASLLQMAVAATGVTTPFQNAVLQESIDVVSCLHSLRALRLS